MSSPCLGLVDPFLLQTQPVTPGMAVVFGIILLTFALFVSEALPVDVTAIVVVVLLIVLEPWTTITPADGIAGFSNEATVTVLAMFILSEGIRRSGAIQILSGRIVSFAGADERRQLLSVVGLSGLSAGFINNTPVVAVLIPLVNDIARRTGTSPSKLLIPLSYAAMFGGMLTLIGTSTNLLASSVSARLLDRPFTMFEFTSLGAIVLLTGGLYLLVVGRHLIPERITPEERLTEEFEMAEYLAEVRVDPDSLLVGRSVAGVISDIPLDFDVVQIVREGRPLTEPLGDSTVAADDFLVVRASRSTILNLAEAEGLSIASLGPDGVEVEAGAGDEAERLAEVVVVPRTSVPGETLSSAAFRERYNAAVLAIRRGGDVVHDRLEQLPLQGGDMLLVLATERALSRLDDGREFVVVRELDRSRYRTERIPVALGIVAGVVAVAAAGIYPILVTALAGIVAMVVTGCVRPSELYDSVDWSVIFLLAGVIPLGIALERTGGAAWIADLIVATAGVFPVIVVLGIFYLVTALLTEMISNNASVVLMIPVAVDAAARIDANAFAFVLAVTFAASTSILTPIGYQTNLMVYGPGGYRFTDFFRVGAPLQLLLAVVTTLGIATIWGV
jgi:di/tricarboxylate transporter